MARKSKPYIDRPLTRAELAQLKKAGRMGYWLAAREQTRQAHSRIHNPTESLYNGRYERQTAVRHGGPIGLAN